MPRLKGSIVSAQKKDITGFIFGKLKVISLISYNLKRRDSLWLCVCECGEKVEKFKNNLKKGTVSCGCYQKEATKKSNSTHKSSYSEQYRLYANMKRHGGVCKSWDTYEKFNEWIEFRKIKIGFEIKRHNVNAEYSPENCTIMDRTKRQRFNSGHKISTSKYKGVSWSSSEEKWKAQIYHKGKRITIGRFSSEYDAVVAYEKKAQQLLGDNRFKNQL